MAKMMPRKTLLMVFGATGTGKSQLAIDLAKRFNGEIINSDSMQMYAGFPIITNKVTEEEKQGIPHHLLGYIGLDEEPCRVGAFQREAGSLIRQIRDRNRVPIVVGGTHYYIQSLLFPDSIVDRADGRKSESQEPESAQDLSAQFPILNGPPETILKKLTEVDPVMAARWHPHDIRKIRRSLEIYLTTGERASDLYARQKKTDSLPQPCSTEQQTQNDYLDPTSTLLFWTYVEPTILKKRLDVRVEKMMKSGLLDEVKSMDQYLESQQCAGVQIDQTRGIWSSIGWKEFGPYLKALKTGGCIESALDLSIELTQIATRQYAKRQLRWIKLSLRPALAGCETLNQRLYVLDASKASSFEHDVSNLAISVTADSLTGRELQSAQGLSATARDILGTSSEKPNVWFRKTCEICQRTVMNEIEWNAHLNSRKHRTSLKRNFRKSEVITPKGAFSAKDTVT